MSLERPASIEKSPKAAITRRDALRLGGLFALALGSACTREVNIAPDSETREFADKIMHYRRKLGLRELPFYYGSSVDIDRFTDWNSTPEEIRNELPDKNKSYGMRLKEVVEMAFGENGNRLISSVYTDNTAPSAVFFESVLRRCGLPDDVRNMAHINGDFDDYVLHEAIGHGSDTAMVEAGPIYPKEQFFQIELGKWKALAEAFDVEGQFFNHPDDMMFNHIKTSLGESVALYHVFSDDVDIEEITNRRGMNKLTDTIQDIARRKGIEVEELKFNKSVCREIGEKIADPIRKGEFEARGILYDSYRFSLEGALIEIYAEAMKYAIKYPELLSDSPQILEGVAEVISAIRGSKVRVEDLGSVIGPISQDVWARFRQESGYRKNTDNETVAERKTPVEQRGLLEGYRLSSDMRELLHDYMKNQRGGPARMTPMQFSENQASDMEAFLVTMENSTLSDQEVVAMVNDQINYMQREFMYYKYIYSGYFPDEIDVNDEMRGKLNILGSLYVRVCLKEPLLFNTFRTRSDMDFDPNYLHIWEIRKITEAMNYSYFRSLFWMEDINNQLDIDELNGKIAEMRTFLSVWDERHPSGQKNNLG
jgi:hypothetical protein